jgi:hypothetical protein
MRIRAHGLALFLVIACLAGCAALFEMGAGPHPDRIAERGLAALERGDFEEGIADLEWVSAHFPERASGRYALLALAAAELDPANPQRRADVGAELLASFRALDEKPLWTVPVANSLRGLVLELRDTQERARVAERAAARAERSAREAAERARAAARQASQAESRQASLGSRVADLERELAHSRQQLARTREEVDRMRRTLGN